MVSVVSDFGLANDNSIWHDYVLPFMIKNLGVHGRIVDLDTSITKILNKHKYHPSVEAQLAQLIVFTTMLGSNLKTPGLVTAEIRTEEGAVSLMVVDYDHPGKIRGYARMRDDLSLDKEYSYNELFKKGFMVITMDLGLTNSQRYQGIVDLSNNSVVESVETYLKNSHQVEAAIKIAYDCNKQGDLKQWHASGLMVQKLPSGGELLLEEEDDDWSRVCQFVDSITDSEMLFKDISPKDLLVRLFHNDDVLLFDQEKIEHKCRCSRQKMQQIVDSMSLIEKERIKINGKVEVKCEFCNDIQYFD